MPATDERGKPRISGIGLDIGAVEVQQFVVSTLVEENDGVNTGGISLRDALNPYPTPPPATARDWVVTTFPPAYGLTVGTDDSTLDSDGDESPDAVENANMTNPTNPNSILKILSFVPSDGPAPPGNPLFDVTFSSFPGLSYTLDCDQNLDCSSPAARFHPRGPAAVFTTTEQLPLLPARDFVRVRRDP